MLKRVKLFDILKISLKFIEFSLVVKRSQVSKLFKCLKIKDKEVWGSLKYSHFRQ